MKKELIKLANHLDRIGLVKEANYVDALIKRAQAGKMKMTACDKFSHIKEIRFKDARFLAILKQGDVDRQYGVYPSLPEYMTGKSTRDARYQEIKDGKAIRYDTDFKRLIVDTGMIDDYKKHKEREYGDGNIDGDNVGHLGGYITHLLALETFGESFASITQACNLEEN